MSKRLKEIIERTGKVVDYGGEIDHMDVAWLINRVETLESVTDQDMPGIKKTLEDNQRYKQALEFYEVYENYEPEPFGDDWMSRIEFDWGEIARKALEGEE